MNITIAHVGMALVAVSGLAWIVGFVVVYYRERRNTK